MNIASVIRMHRKELNLTQEQIAEKLGVSAPAVNKWENGNSYPDILLLGPLARLLGIDLNTLLGFHSSLTDMELNEISQTLSSLFRSEGYEAGCHACENYLKDYPSCPKLFLIIGMLMDSFLLFLPDIENPDIYEDRILSLIGEVAACEDRQVSEAALSWLVTHYLRLEAFEKAEEHLDRISEQTVDKNTLRSALYLRKKDYEQAENAYQNLILQNLNRTLSSLVLYGNLCIKQKNTERARRIAELSCETIKQFELHLMFPYTLHLEIALDQKNTEEVWRYLDDMADFYLQNPFPDLSQTLLFFNVKTSSSFENMQAILNLMIKSLQTDEEMAFLRDDPSFKKRLEVLQSRIS